MKPEFVEDENIEVIGARSHNLKDISLIIPRNKLVVMTGLSGSGKSSLVNCGLRPALHRGLMARAGSAWRVVYFRPGATPIRALAQALAAEGSLYSGYAGEIPLAEVMETHLRMSNRGLVDVVRKARLPERTNLLLVADQFEELFRYRKLASAASGDAAISSVGVPEATISPSRRTATRSASRCASSM